MVSTGTSQEAPVSIYYAIEDDIFKTMRRSLSILYTHIYNKGLSYKITFQTYITFLVLIFQINDYYFRNLQKNLN